MKAVSFARFGGPEVLEVVDVAEPHPTSGQIRVAVRAAAVNPFDAKVRRGLMQPGLPKSLPSVPGYDAAGVVDEVGAGVTEWAVGDEVLGHGFSGAYAEFSVADAVGVARRPGGLPWELAGGFGSVASAAERVLRQLDVQSGQTLFVHGATGAVGQLAVQLAVRRGATVVGSGGPDNQQQLADLGAVPVVFGAGFAERVRAAVPRVDRALDVGGRGELPELVALTGDPDRVITIADPKAAESGVRFSAGGDDGGLAPLVDLLAAGDITLAVAAVFPLADVVAAHQFSESGRATGRIILRIS